MVLWKRVQAVTWMVVAREKEHLPEAACFRLGPAFWTVARNGFTNTGQIFDPGDHLKNSPVMKSAKTNDPFQSTGLINVRPFPTTCQNSKTRLPKTLVSFTSQEQLSMLLQRMILSAFNASLQLSIGRE